MEKLLKSIFHTTDRRKSPHYENEGEDEKGESAQIGARRQLSISRSGRMKQANKKRHSLTLELYGDSIQIDAVERPTSVEYHVHSSNHTATLSSPDSTRFRDTGDIEELHQAQQSTKNNLEVALETGFRKITLEKSPEEEIDNAFEVIDKS